MTDGKQKRAKQVTLTVTLTIPELAALSSTTVVVTSTAEQVVINNADRALRKIRAAALHHPQLPPVVR
ncbi:hypothetical protein [Actinokineospora sp. NBRC 105648]|uniref:hypothetical protein n=1 Tax=Actinokineospora sp. NBRC 105648 TaxID=3032206 RepID=UPI0024A53E93|nr:hypothetical protein [Actinokineospora sp. NBRC 105648]GLZ40924.1 hypothetical protein Acsp05_45480 [Actinokineospora sp. NBRC 105648]